jgi:hypothetical protein
MVRPESETQMSRGNGQLTELTVTPFIAHAVAELRAVVSVRRGAVSLDAGFNEFGFEGRKATITFHGGREARVPLTPQQEAAAWMLVGIGAFYESLWRKACGVVEIDETKAPPPARYVVLERRFNEDVRRKLKAKIEGYVIDIDNHLNGHVTVYR